MAKFLFIGLDANYVKQVESQDIFTNICEYHADGVGFWQKHSVHHPFLLDSYKGDGRKYHRNFARIGFTAEHSQLISFAELLHVPTVGRNPGLAETDFSSAHLKKLNSWILDGDAEHIFISSGVARLMTKSKHFSWLPVKSKDNLGKLGAYWRDGKKTVYSHLHFSNWGQFEKQMLIEAEAIRSLLNPLSLRQTNL